jgi:hypothetical protein
MPLLELCNGHSSIFINIMSFPTCCELARKMAQDDLPNHLSEYEKFLQWSLINMHFSSPPPPHTTKTCLTIFKWHFHGSPAFMKTSSLPISLIYSNQHYIAIELPCQHANEPSPLPHANLATRDCGIELSLLPQPDRTITWQLEQTAPIHWIS